MNKYKKKLLDYASKLDAIVEGYAEITKYATAIVEENNEESTLALLRKISELADAPQYPLEVKKLANELNKSLIEFYGYSKIIEICKRNELVEDNKSLSELLNDLDKLIGLQGVKEKVGDLITYQKVQKKRKEHNLNNMKNTMHLAFTGNPGTGKTTVARIVGRIYKQIGLLSKGHFVEVSRTDLIAGYQGQTALKVKKVIERSRGGVLFIDEAYSITENEHSDSYGRECLTELTKALEDYRDDLVVIVAGYTEPMNKFFESNPGLKSRFNNFIEFADFQAKELKEILAAMCSDNDYTMNKELVSVIREFFDKQVQNKNNNFANGRMVRNIYDDLVMNHAKRVEAIDNVSKEELSLLIEQDFQIRTE